LTLNKAISANSLLKIYRETTTDTIVSWNDASVLRAKDMSLQEVQLLHLAEETADKVFDTGMSTSPTNTNVWDGQYKRLTNLLDPQEGGDAVTLRYINSNKSNLINDLKNEGANQKSSIVATGNAQNTRLTNTGNSYVSTMTTLKGDTTTKANEAKNSATSASSSASTATTKANEANNSATSASSSASTATTKANEAKSSADLAKKWAMSDSSPDGVSGNKSSKTWANEAKNSATSASSSASTATTKATEASNSASAAAKSAENAKTWDPSSYYTKTDIKTDNSWFFDYLHRFGKNKTLPTTNKEINKLGVFSSFYTVANTIKNQPTPYGQLINIPADNNNESTQLWITQSYGNIYHRGGNGERNINDTPFKRFLDEDDMSNIVNMLYPVGTVYMSADKRKTKADFIFMQYGTWEEVPANLCLQTGNAGEAGTQRRAGLPNITGKLNAEGAKGSQFLADTLTTISGAFSVEGKGQKVGIASDENNLTGFGYTALNFNASASNSIYGSSNTVQPPAYMVRAWVRTA
jgi:hypothetical protein